MDVSIPEMQDLVWYVTIWSVVLKLMENNLTHVFAVVDWLKPSQRDFDYQNPLSVWYAKQYELAGPAAFLPLQRVHSRFISVEELHDDVKYLVVSPVCRRIYL